MAYINSKNLYDKYVEDKTLFEAATGDYPIYTLQALGYPTGQKEDGTSDVTEQTMATIIDELPKRVLPRAPSAKVKMSNPVYQEMMDEILNKHLIPNANSQAPYLDKWHLMISEGAVYGLQYVEVFGHNSMGRYLTDFRLPSAVNCITDQLNDTAYMGNYIFIRVPTHESQIRLIIEEEEQKKKDNPNYKSEWSLPKLEDALEHARTSSIDDATSNIVAGDAVSQSENMVVLVYLYQKGLKSYNYVFLEDSGTTRTSNKAVIVKRTRNRDLDELLFVPYYHKIVLSNLYGQGIAAQLHAEQNVADQVKRLITRDRVMQLDPPMLVNTGVQGEVRLDPGGIMKTPVEAKASEMIAPVELNTVGKQTYLETTAADRSLMYNRTGTYNPVQQGITGSPSQSNTARGVQQRSERLGTNDLALRLRAKYTIGQILTRMLKLFIKHMKTTTNYRIDKKRWTRIRERTAIDPTKVKTEAALLKAQGKYADFDNDGNMIMKVPFQKIYEDMVEDVTAVIDAEFPEDKAEKARDLLDRFHQGAGDPRSSTLLDPRVVYRTALTDLGYDAEELMVDASENPAEAPITIAKVEEIANAISLRNDSNKYTDGTMSFDKLTPEQRHAKAAQVGLPPQGEYPDQVDDREKAEGLQIEKFKVALEAVKLAVEDEEKFKKVLALIEGKTQQPVQAAQIADKADPQAAQAAEEGGQQRAIEGMTNALQRIKTLGGSDADIEETTRILLEARNGVLTAEEATAQVQAIIKRLGG